MIRLLLLLAGAAPVAPAPDPRAIAVVDSAISRMGGAEVLGRLGRVRYELVTQWQRIVLDGRPYADRPSFEWHTDVRDYTIPAWRNTRRFGTPAKPVELTDVVRDSVAIRRFNGPWQPLSMAYVDERRELFAFAPERLLPGLHGAPDLRSLSDTAIAGVPHARLAATVEGFPAVVLIRRTDGLPAMARYVAAQPNDFGLAPLGTMEVEVWYSNWQRQPQGVNLPTQWDIRRAGMPYKRVTVVSADFGIAAMPDSFAVVDSLRAAYLATERRPMHDLPYDSTRLVDGSFVAFNTPGAPAGAVKVGGRWLLLETGQAALSANRAMQALAAVDPAPVAAAVVTVTAGQNGGAVALVGKRVPLHVAPAAADYLALVLRNHGVVPGGITAVRGGRWLRIGTDSVRLEPMDLPDAPGAMLVYVPSLRYAYSATAAAPLQREYVLRRIRELGWPVERLGSASRVTTPVTP
jgi:hypothetical protein